MSFDAPILSDEDKRLIDSACAWVGLRGYSTNDLDRHQRIVVMVIASQGVIDNGGLEAFFDCDFPGTPPYSQFIEAFEVIGAKEAADALRKAVCVFSVDKPEADFEHRRVTMDRLGLRGYFGEFRSLTDQIMGQGNFHFGLLAKFIREHGLSFQTALQGR